MLLTFPSSVIIKGSWKIAASPQMYKSTNDKYSSVVMSDWIESLANCSRKLSEAGRMTKYANNTPQKARRLDTKNVMNTIFWLMVSWAGLMNANTW